MRLQQSNDTVEPPKSEPASKVCVTFYECKKPVAVNPIESQEFYDSSYFETAMSSPIPESILTPTLDRQISNGNGYDNPFRPDGDISREADEIVQKIKSGQSLVSSPHSPITNTSESLNNANLNSPLKGEDESVEIKAKNYQNQTPQNTHTQVDGGSPAKSTKAGLNGSKADDSTSPGPVEVKHATVTPTEPAQVEHVILKKKKKCACCVIQ